MTQGSHGGADFSRFQQFVTLCVDHTTLIIGDVVVFEQLFTYIEVTAFDLALRRL